MVNDDSLCFYVVGYSISLPVLTQVMDTIQMSLTIAFQWSMTIAFASMLSATASLLWMRIVDEIASET